MNNADETLRVRHYGHSALALAYCPSPSVAAGMAQTEVVAGGSITTCATTSAREATSRAAARSRCERWK